MTRSISSSNALFSASTSSRVCSAFGGGGGGGCLGGGGGGNKVGSSTSLNLLQSILVSDLCSLSVSTITLAKFSMLPGAHLHFCECTPILTTEAWSCLKALVGGFGCPMIIAIAPVSPLGL